ncbi:hypothetical protein PG984_006615 [Apiospora sp. TS-2023a]
MPVSQAERFHSFSKLPKELQLSIWKLAASEPQVHYATLTRKTASSPPPVPSRGRRRAFLPFQIDLVQDNAAPGRPEPNTLWPPLDALLRAVKDSRAVAQRLLESSHPVFLNPNPTAPLDRGRFPALRVRPMTDLVILSAGWQDQLDMRGRIISHRQVQDVPQLCCLGVSCATASDTGIPTLDGERFRKFLNATEGLMRVYWALRVLYVVVEPEQLRACEGSWRRDTKSPGPGRDLEQHPDDDDDDDCESASEENEVELLAGFLAAYEKGLPPALFFGCDGTREYFELTTSQVAELGGLADVVSALETVRRKHPWADTADDSDALELAGIPDGKPKPLYFRFLTWRERKRMGVSHGTDDM